VRDGDSIAFDVKARRLDVEADLAPRQLARQRPRGIRVLGPGPFRRAAEDAEPFHAPEVT